MNNVKINNEIKATKVRVVGEFAGVYSFREALNLANSKNLDLIEINSSVSPSICKILDYQKYQYQQKKKEKENKAKQSKVEIKEIRLSYNIGDNDLLTKEKQALKFLSNKDKVLLTMFFKGRTIMYVEQGKAKITQFINDLSDSCVVEKSPTLEGKKLICLIKSKN